MKIKVFCINLPYPFTLPKKKSLVTDIAISRDSQLKKYLGWKHADIFPVHLLILIDTLHGLAFWHFSFHLLTWRPLISEVLWSWHSKEVFFNIVIIWLKPCKHAFQINHSFRVSLLALPCQAKSGASVSDRFFNIRLTLKWFLPRIVHLRKRSKSLTLRLRAKWRQNCWETFSDSSAWIQPRTSYRSQLQNMLVFKDMSKNCCLHFFSLSIFLFSTE